MVECNKDRKFSLLKVDLDEKVNVTYALLYDKTNEKILMVKTKGRMVLITHYQVVQLN